MAMGQSAYSLRHTHAMAMARSLPVSVPVWGLKGGRAQGENNSGERVSTYNLKNLLVCMQRLNCLGEIVGQAAGFALNSRFQIA